MSTPERERLRSRFREAGAVVDDAVAAFTGLYPFFGGTGTWEILFTRHRVIAHRGPALTVWGAFAGPSPTRPLQTYALTDLAAVTSGGAPGRAGEYDRVTLAGKTFWVAAADRDIIHGWLAAARQSGCGDLGVKPVRANQGQRDEVAAHPRA